MVIDHHHVNLNSLETEVVLIIIIDLWFYKSLSISAVSHIPNSEDAVSLAGDAASPNFGICHTTHLFGTYHNKSNHLPLPSKTSYARRTTYSYIDVWKSQCCWKNVFRFLSFQNLHKNFFSILHYLFLYWANIWLNKWLKLTQLYKSLAITRLYTFLFMAINSADKASIFCFWITNAEFHKSNLI
jgi:hypothetical protein